MQKLYVLFEKVLAHEWQERLKVTDSVLHRRFEKSNMPFILNFKKKNFEV